MDFWDENKFLAQKINFWRKKKFLAQKNDIVVLEPSKTLNGDSGVYMNFWCKNDILRYNPHIYTTDVVIANRMLCVVDKKLFCSGQ